MGGEQVVDRLTMVLKSSQCALRFNHPFASGTSFAIFAVTVSTRHADADQLDEEAAAVAAAADENQRERVCSHADQ